MKDHDLSRIIPSGVFDIKAPSFLHQFREASPTCYHAGARVSRPWSRTSIHVFHRGKLTPGEGEV
jgi:hypothetical protein